MAKSKAFPKEVFVTIEEPEDDDASYFLANRTLDDAFDGTEECGQIKIATYVLNSVALVKRELKKTVL